MPSHTRLRRPVLAGLAATAIAAGVVPAIASSDAPGPIVFAAQPAQLGPFAIPKAIATDVPALGADRVAGTSDDASLHVTVYDPDTSGAPSWRKPVILMFGPNGFDDTVQAQAFYGIPAGIFLADKHYEHFLIDHEVPRGYTVVLAEMRGTAKSSGCWDVWGKQDAADFHDLVTWASQAGWDPAHRPAKPRAVGAYGASAEAIGITNGLFGAPLALKTVVDWQSFWSWYDEYALDGVPQAAAPFAPTEYYGATLGANADGDSAELTHATCPSTATTAEDFSGDENQWFQERDYRLRDYSTIHASVLALNGSEENTIIPMAWKDDFDRIPTFHRLIFPWWDHILPDPMKDPSQNTHWRGDIDGLVDAWFDQMLAGIDTGVRSWPKVQVQDQHNVWRAVDSVAGMTASTQDEALGTDLLPMDPVSQAGTFGTGVVAKFASTPLTSDLHLSGEVTLDASMEFSDPTARLQMSLWAVNGTSRHLIRMGLRSANHLDSTIDTSAVTPGDYYTVHVRTPYVDEWVPQGSTLELDLQGVGDPTGAPDAVPMVAGHYFTVVPSAPYVATVKVDASSVLHLPISNDSCGLSIADAAQPDAGWSEPACPTRIADELTRG